MRSLKKNIVVYGVLIASTFFNYPSYGGINNKEIQRLEYRTDDRFSKDDDATLLARLIYGEARGEFPKMKRAIGDVVINRKNKRNQTLREIILEPNQFTCFNNGDINRNKLKKPLKYESRYTWKECLRISRETLSTMNIDDSNGATHYYDTSIKEPKWARGKKPVLVLEKRNGKEVRFYKLDR